jgi:hypothetical protein
VLLVAAGDRIQIHGSANLRDWELLSEFGTDHGSHGGVWSAPTCSNCPWTGSRPHQVGPRRQHQPGRARRWIGDPVLHRRFRRHPVHRGRLARGGSLGRPGADFYVRQSFSDVPDGRRLWLGWTSNWNYADKIPTDPWRGMMSTPRQLSLATGADGGAMLVQQPVEELAGARQPAGVERPADRERRRGVPGERGRRRRPVPARCGLCRGLGRLRRARRAEDPGRLRHRGRGTVRRPDRFRVRAGQRRFPGPPRHTAGRRR